MTSFAGRIKKAFSDMKVHRKLIVAYVLTGLFPMCLMFTLFYTQMRRVLVEREIKNLQTTFDQAVDDVNTELALHQSMSDCDKPDGRWSGIGRRSGIRSGRRHGRNRHDAGAE